MRGLAEGINLVSVYGKDLESNGALMDTALRCIHLGPIILHLFLINDSYWNSRPFLFVLNSAMVIAIIICNVMLRRTRVDKITEFPKYLRKAKMLAPSVVDELDWTYKFSHPLVKRLPQFPHVIKELNSDYNEIALKQRSTKDSKSIVEKRKLQPKLNIKQMIEMEMDPRVLNRTKSMIESDLPSSLKRASGVDPKDCLRSLSCEEKIKHESDEEDQNSSDEFIDGIKDKFDLEDRANLQKSKLRTGGKKVFGLVGEKTLNPYKRRPEIRSILELYPKSDLPQVGGTVVNTEMNQINDPVDNATVPIDHEDLRPKPVPTTPINKEARFPQGSDNKKGPNRGEEASEQTTKKENRGQRVQTHSLHH
jgi:hypothetical protein